MEKLTRTGAALGIFDELALSDIRLTLAPGDTLVAYTDGLTDALNPLGEDYGITRLAQAIARASQPNAIDLLDHLLNDLAAFTQGIAPFDDITLLILLSETPKGIS